MLARLFACLFVCLFVCLWIMRPDWPVNIFNSYITIIIIVMYYQLTESNNTQLYLQVSLIRSNCGPGADEWMEMD